MNIYRARDSDLAYYLVVAESHEQAIRYLTEYLREACLDDTTACSAQEFPLSDLDKPLPDLYRQEEPTTPLEMIELHGPGVCFCSEG